MAESVRSGVGIALGFLLLGLGLCALGLCLFLAVLPWIAGYPILGLAIALGSCVAAGAILAVTLHKKGVQS